jgi:TolA-binding protein
MRLRDLFLRRYPTHALAADMYYDQGVSFLAEGDYRAAKEKFRLIENNFPSSAVAAEAKEIALRLSRVN